MPQVERQLEKTEDTNTPPRGMETFRFPPAILCRPTQSAEAVLTSLAPPILPQRATPKFSAHKINVTLL